MSDSINIGVSFPGELLAVEALVFLRHIWGSLSEEQQQQVAGWVIEDVEKLRRHIKAPEPQPSITISADGIT